MSVPTQSVNKETPDTQPQTGFSPQQPGLLFFALVLLAAVLFANHEPLTTYAVTPAAPESGQIGEGPPAPKTAGKSAEKLAATPTIWPVKGDVTSGFGWRTSPFEDGNELHAGLDIAKNMGAPVVATADGQVVRSGLAGGYGNMVQIDHGNGIATIYGHNSELAVIVGQSVKKGQVIAYVGSTGKSTGPHVHYEVRENGNAVDPWKYLIAHR